MRIVAKAMLAAIIFTAWAVPAAIYGEEYRPSWRKSYAEAYAAGKAKRRPVLVVIDKPDQPAYRIEQVSGERSPGGADTPLLANYELCHIDATTEYGQSIAALFNVKQYPHVAITDRRVEVLLFQRSGKMASGDWANVLAKYRQGEIEPPAVICST